MLPPECSPRNAAGKRWLVAGMPFACQRELRRRMVGPLCGGVAVAPDLSPDSALPVGVNPAGRVL